LNDPNRYARNILVPEIGTAGQEKLCKSSVLVVGAGGLGSPVLYYMAAAGVGSITVIDGDTVEISNLQRQIIHTEEDLGVNKAKSAKNKIERLNCNVEIKAVDRFLVLDDIEQCYSSCYDLIFDCTDNFAARKTINSLSLNTKSPFLYAATNYFNGQLALFDPNNENTGCYNCLFEDPEDNSDPTPVSSTTPGIIGSLAAGEGLKWLLGLNTPSNGYLMLVDSLALTIKKISLSRNLDCTECGKNDTI